jgi:hypothetical protein
MTDTITEAKRFLNRNGHDLAEAYADACATVAEMRGQRSHGYAQLPPSRDPEWRGKPQPKPLGVEAERPDPNPEGGR